MMAATNTIWFAFCLLLVAAGDGLLVAGDDGEDGRLAPFALDDQARAFGREYMQVDKKKMKHRRRILIRDLDVDDVFRRQPMVSYLDVGMRYYGPSVANTPSDEMDGLVNAAFSLIAGIVDVCCNQKTQLLSVGPAISPPRHYEPPGAWGNMVPTEPGQMCTFDASKYRSVDMRIRWSLYPNSSMVEFTGDSNIAYNDARAEVMLKKGYEVKWLIDLEHKVLDIALEIFQPKGTCILTPAFSYRLTLQMDGPCLSPFTVEKQTAVLEVLSPLLIKATSVYVLRVEEVHEMVSAPGWDASVRLMLLLAKYENSYMASMEEALSVNGSGIFVAGPDGLSPFQHGMANIGLPVMSARVVELLPDPGPFVSDRDWLNMLDARDEALQAAYFWVKILAAVLAVAVVASAGWGCSRRGVNLGTNLDTLLRKSMGKEVSFAAAQSSNSSIDALWNDDTIPSGDLMIAVRADSTLWVLGRGSYGTVYKGYLAQVQEVAIKVFTNQEGKDGLLIARRKLLKEVALLKSCRCPSIVQFLGVSFVEDDVWLVMEYLEGGNLFQAIERNPDWTWVSHRGRIALDVAKGMAFLHSHGVIHLDLKSPNILLSKDGKAKVADVGVAYMLADSKTHASNLSAGTFMWTAPEVLLYGRATYSADVFSYGVILWELATGEPPRRGRLRPVRVPEECPQEVSRLIERCMQQDSKKRPTAHEIITALRDTLGMLPDYLAREQDNMPSHAPTGMLHRSNSSGRGRRFISGLTFARADLEPIYGEDDAEEGDGETASRMRLTIPQHLLEGEEESGGDSDQGPLDLEHAGSGYSMYVSDEPEGTAEDGVAFARAFNARKLSRKWKSLGEDRSLLSTAPSYHDDPDFNGY